MDTRPAVVTLMSDYSCGWPLWARGSLDDTSAEALGLSEELTNDLLEIGLPLERSRVHVQEAVELQS